MTWTAMSQLEADQHRRSVLVTGVGAIIGYGVVNSLRLSRYPVTVLGIDIYPHAAGQTWCDAFECSLKVADPGYQAFLANLIARYRIDLIIPAIEQDVTVLSRHRSNFERTGAKLALNAADLIELSDDKWNMHQALVSLGAPTIDTMLSREFEEFRTRLGLPFLIKPRRSYASKGIAIVSEPEELAWFRRKLGDNFMAQRIIGDADGEVTASMFGYRDGGRSRKIVFQRWLSQEGATNRAQTVDVPQLEAEMDRLPGAFRPPGPTKFPFRGQKGPDHLLSIKTPHSSPPLPNPPF